MPEVFEETFNALGEKIEQHLQLKRLDPTYRVHFHDDTTLDLSPDLEMMRRQLDDIEPGSFESFLRFMAEGYRNYRLSLQHFVGRNFNSLLDYFSLRNLPLLFKLKALVKHRRSYRQIFQRPTPAGSVFLPKYVPGGEPLRGSGNLLAAPIHRAGRRRLVSNGRHVSSNRKPSGDRRRTWGTLSL